MIQSRIFENKSRSIIARDMNYSFQREFQSKKDQGSQEPIENSIILSPSRWAPNGWVYRDKNNYRTPNKLKQTDMKGFYCNSSLDEKFQNSNEKLPLQSIYQKSYSDQKILTRKQRDNQSLPTIKCPDSQMYKTFVKLQQSTSEAFGQQDYQPYQNNQSPVIDQGKYQRSQQLLDNSQVVRNDYSLNGVTSLNLNFFSNNIFNKDQQLYNQDRLQNKNFNRSSLNYNSQAIERPSDQTYNQSIYSSLNNMRQTDEKDANTQLSISRNSIASRGRVDPGVTFWAGMFVKKQQSKDEAFVVRNVEGSQSNRSNSNNSLRESTQIGNSEDKVYFSKVSFNRKYNPYRN
eukprot:403346533